LRAICRPSGHCGSLLIELDFFGHDFEAWKASNEAQGLPGE
jgi:hypothetical protein